MSHGTSTFPGALAHLQREIDAVRAELGRVDGKANMLLATALGMLTAVTALAVTGPRLAAPAAAPGAALVWLAVILLAAAVATLLLTVRPRIPRTGGTGFVAHARTSDAAQLLAGLAAERPEARMAADLHLLSTLAVVKYRLIRRAVHLMLASLLVLAASLPPLALGVQS